MDACELVSNDPGFAEDLVMAEKEARNEALLLATAPDYGQVAEVDFSLRQQVIRELVGVGADTNAFNSKNGNTPLCNAVLRNDVALVDLLVSLGAKHEPDSTDKHDRHVAPFHLACFVGQTDIAKHLLLTGANLHHVDREGANALCYAAEGGSLNTLAWLCESGLSLSSCDFSGRSPLCRVSLQPEADRATVDKIIDLHASKQDAIVDIRLAFECLDNPSRDRQNRYVESERYKLRQHLTQRLEELEFDLSHGDLSS